MSSTNSDWDIFQNLIYNYIKLKKRRFIDERLKFRKTLTTSIIFVSTSRHKRLKAFESILRNDVNNEENVKNNENDLNNT